MFMPIRLLLAGFLIAIALPTVGAELQPLVGGGGAAAKGNSFRYSKSGQRKAAPVVPHWVMQDAQVRSLPAGLDNVLVLNSNSPEIVGSDGILVSTFPTSDKRVPSAHLDLPLNGRFDIFVHHRVKAINGDMRTLYQGILLQNPTSEPVQVTVLQAASFLERPHAPFVRLPAITENPVGRVFAGSGDRITDFILRGCNQSGWPTKFTLAPGQSKMLYSLPIPIQGMIPPSNCRCAIAKLETTGKVYAASLAMRALRDGAGRERQPSLGEWQNLLRNGSLVTPRDRPPTLPKSTRSVIYGRVAGVSRGNTWRALICEDTRGGVRLNVAPPGKAFSYVLSTVEQGAFGTMNYQSAPMVVRYPDTAHQADGNYGVHYELTLPLYNDQAETQRVTVTLQSPYKTNRPDHKLLFREPPIERVFYRGTVRIRYRDDYGTTRLRYVHLVLNQADESKPLVTLQLAPGETRMVSVDFLYAPDSTPPQILSVKTLERPE